MTDDYVRTVQRIEKKIDRFFASNRTTEEKMYGANKIDRELLKLNRMVAEDRGIGREFRLIQNLH